MGLSFPLSASPPRQTRSSPFGRTMISRACFAWPNNLATRWTGPPKEEIGAWQRGDIGSAGSERLAASRERTLPDGVEDDIVTISSVENVLAAVVDNEVGPERAHKVDVRGSASSRRHGSKRLCDLDREMPDPTGAAVDEDF